MARSTFNYDLAGRRMALGLLLGLALVHAGAAGPIAALDFTASIGPRAESCEFVDAVTPIAYQVRDEAPFDDAVVDAEETAAANQAEATAEEVEPLVDGDANPRRIYRPITQVTVNTALPPGLLPETLEREDGAPPPVVMPLVGDARLSDGWGDQVFAWSATQFCHGPLYFEEVNLERYGYQCHPAVQPFVSGAHFFLTVPVLPYKMTVHPPRECIYTLGHYRPGNRVPWQRHRQPWDSRAAAVQAGVAVGLVFLIP